MKKYISISVLFLVFIIAPIQAQQDVQYTQYMYNTIVVNSGYTGSRGVFSTGLLHRSQWQGVKGAPTSQSFNIHSPVAKNMGLGLAIVNDEIGSGTSKETSVVISASYTIKTSTVGKLSFGISGGAHLLNVDYASLKGYVNQLGDLPNVDNKFSPNVGLGVYYHTNKFYLGLSVPKILETKHFDTSGNNESFVSTERMNYYLITGYVFKMSPTLKFKPAILMKAVSGAPLQADVSANFLFNDKFSLGAAYRWDAAFSGMLGFQVTDGLMLGLAYDKEITALGNSTFNSGSFEVFLRFELISKMKKIISPRFF